MTSCYKDSRSFNGMQSAQQEDSNGAAYVQSILGNELRVGKYCMINDFPCKIRAIHRAAPGKHGHAKLRTVGLGVFDGKKREAIFIAQHVAPVPVVRNHTVRAETTKDGFRLESDEGHRLPSLLPYSEEMTIANQAQHVELSIVTTCGHFKVTAIRASSAAKTTTDATGASLPQIISKKEMRKQKKQMRKQEIAKVRDAVEAQSNVAATSCLVESR